MDKKWIMTPKDIDVPKEEVKEISKKDRENLSGCEVDPGEEYKTGKARRLYPKGCYKQAFNYMAAKGDIEGVKLVHGLYKPPSFHAVCDHAWVELPGEIVFDGVLQRFYKKESYYQYYQAVKQNEYSKNEMYEVGLKNGGNYGPWIEFN